jgi:hypothetical protein
MKPPHELVDDLLDIVDDIDEVVVEEPPQIVPPTVIKVETRLCSNCGRHPAVPYRLKCQDCCITDAIRPKAGGML